MTNEELFKRLNDGDESIRCELIQNNMGLVYNTVEKCKGYRNAAFGYEDMVSVGTIGLIKAVNAFDPELGNMFSTFAAKCVLNQILYELRRLGRQPKMYSLDATIEYDNPKSGRASCKMTDYLEDRKQRFEKRIEDRDTLRRVAKHLEAVPPANREALRLHLRYRGQLPQSRMAEMVGVSQPTFSKRLRKAQMLIKRAMIESGEL